MSTHITSSWRTVGSLNTHNKHCHCTSVLSCMCLIPPDHFPLCPPTNVCLGKCGINAVQVSPTHSLARCLGWGRCVVGPVPPLPTAPSFIPLKSVVPAAASDPGCPLALPQAAHLRNHFIMPPWDCICLETELKFPFK